MPKLAASALAVLTFVSSPSVVTQAQSIVPATDGTNTIVTPSGNRWDISGGTRSQDGANLFQSFQQFGLTTNQVANFLATPQIRSATGSNDYATLLGDPNAVAFTVSQPGAIVNAGSLAVAAGQTLSLLVAQSLTQEPLQRLEKRSRSLRSQGNRW